MDHLHGPSLFLPTSAPERDPFCMRKVRNLRVSRFSNHHGDLLRWVPEVTLAGVPRTHSSLWTPPSLLPLLPLSIFNQEEAWKRSSCPVPHGQLVTDGGKEESMRRKIVSRLRKLLSRPRGLSSKMIINLWLNGGKLPARIIGALKNGRVIDGFCFRDERPQHSDRSCLVHLAYGY